MQVVHAEIDFVAPVRWRDAVRINVTCESTGLTSFTVGFCVLRRTAEEAEIPAVRGRSVYVVVSTQDWTKRPIPDALRRALAPREDA